MNEKKPVGRKPGARKKTPGAARPAARPARRKAGRKPSRLRGWMERHGLWFALVRIAMAGFIILGLALVYFAASLPDIRALDTIKKQQGITVQAADGRVVANYGDVYGQYIPYEQLPKALIQAVVATEDRRFFKHHGVDFFGIARAMVTNLRRGHMVQGGSTITQQVAKNVFLTPDRTIERKVQELLLAFWLEARFSKKEIMAIYLNRVYLGGGAWGVDAASRRYFNKSGRELSLYESAQIAGLLKAPSRYSPTASAARAQGRVHQVLLNMVEAGYLQPKQVKPTLASYAKQPARVAEGGDVRYYTDWVIDLIPEILGQSSEDLVVRTTLDRDLQAEAQAIIAKVISAEGEKKNVSQAALVAMKPDGAVQALVGGTDYAKSPYNRATQAHRQPGSSFKLFVYLAALEAGLTPLSTVEDAPITLQVGNKIWSPNNFEVGGYRGEIPMVEAIRYSLNTVSVRLSQYTGVSRVADMAMRLGVPGIPNRPSIALGSVEATLLEMTGAYAHLPNGGNKLQPYAILSIHTRDGHELYKRPDPSPETVLAKGTVAMMNYMLVDVASRGTGARAALPGRQVAGKTGTSQDYKDAWFIGFTPQLVTGVWVGNDNNRSMKRVTGGSLPAGIWHDFMIKALEGVKPQSLPTSEGSSEGMLPWLFGGNRAESALTAEEGEGVITEVPDDAPVAGEGTSTSSPGDASEADEDAEILTPQFWKKLEDKLPEKKLDYNYPVRNPRHI